MSLPLRWWLLVLLLAGLSPAGGAAAQNQPPVANAGLDQTLECSGPTGAEVTLDGSGSTDPDGDPLTYTWTGEALPEAQGVMPTVELPPGVHVLTLTVDDGKGGTDTDPVTIKVDTTPPGLVLKPDSDSLWPPNHKPHTYLAADLVESVSDDCGESPTEDDVRFERGTSDEDDNGKGDGNTTKDISFHDDCSEADVRAERSGKGDGRVYELFLKVEDEAGNVTKTEEPFRVFVPHDGAHGAVDTGKATEYECGDGLASCAPAPDPTCTAAGAGEVSIRDGGKSARLRWRASGFAPGSISDDGNVLCLYTDGAPSGGSLDPDRVKVKKKKGEGSLAVGTKGSDLEVPELPLAEGATLRLELHDRAGDCVSSDFDAPSRNEPDRYEAESE